MSCYEVTQAINIMGTVCMWPMILEPRVFYRVRKVAANVKQAFGECEPFFCD